MISCLGFAATAKAEPHHGIQAGLDMGFHSFRDDVLVPLAFSGPTLGLGPRYYGAIGPGLLATDVSIALTYVFDREGAEGAAFSWGAHGSYLFAIHEKPWRIAVGPALGWDNDLLVISDWDDAHEHWIGTIWVGPGVRAVRWLRGRWRMDLAGDFALVGFQSRSPAGRRSKQETSNDLSLPFTDPQLVSDATTRLSGMTELELAEETLFPALGIDNYYWEPWPDGVTLGPAGLLLTPRDLAKLGQMVLDGGVWKGERIVSEEWLASSTSEKVLTDSKNPAGGFFPYGYYWWIVPDVGFAAFGHGGQFILVVPARNMVLVQTAYPYASVGDDDLGSFVQLVRTLL